MDVEKINKLIGLTKKKLDLLTELKRSESSVGKPYHLVNPDIDRHHFILVRVIDSENLVYGTPKRIKSYLNIRGISNDKVIDITLLK